MAQMRASQYSVFSPISEPQRVDFNRDFAIVTYCEPMRYDEQTL